jgi:dienelactone hydrolase
MSKTASTGDVLLDRYELIREIGVGGMGTVWLARDQRHDRSVAVKFLRTDLSVGPQAERFLREVSILAHLQHPHILTLIDSGSADGRLFYVMPYIDGETLGERRSREGALPASEAARLLAEVLDALSYAHARGILHRDLKPENVIVSGRHALVMDFGVARALSGAADDDRLTATGTALGTPRYMAPEQAVGEHVVDQRADLYGVGVLAYELLAGEQLFADVSGAALIAAHLMRVPEPLDAKRSGLPPGLADVVMRALSKEPADRWQSAEEMRAALLPFAEEARSATSGRGEERSRRRARAALATAAAAGLVAASFWMVRVGGASEAEWARAAGVLALREAVAGGDVEEAWELGERIRAALPGDSALAALEPYFVTPLALSTEPAGARVTWRPFAGADTTWREVGSTPLEGARVPRQPVRVRVELAGHRVTDLVLVPGLGVGRPTTIAGLVLDPVDAPGADLVRVPDGFTTGLVGINHVPRPALALFQLGRYEVTNAEFKRFVDDEGYTRRDLWEHRFRGPDGELSFEQAVARFVDRTGRPGPATWEAGSYPDGQGEHPVTGVSWYEAAAYAKYAGRALPTVFHWARAAAVIQSRAVVPVSNFGGRGTLPVGASGAINGFGTYDMAGNVREWTSTSTAADPSVMFIVGGGWSDQPYQFTDAYAQSALDRSEINGIRLAMYAANDTTLAQASRPVEMAFRDYSSERPVSDDVFEAYRRLYGYDATPLNETVAERVEERDWIREEVSFDAAYGGERMVAYLFLPKQGTPPFETVVVFPGSNAISLRSLPPTFTYNFEFLMKTGRAVVLPVYKGTLQRGDALANDYQDETAFYRDHVVMWVRDLGRTIDYLETRPELTTERLAYYGVSWGGAMGGLIPAVERRIRTNVLYVAGLNMQRTSPEVDPWNFLPHVTQPTLMLSGRYDFFFPLETAQLPMFEALGTPAADKRHVIQEGGHDVPRAVLIRETLDWLDRYQRP